MSREDCARASRRGAGRTPWNCSGRVDCPTRSRHIKQPPPAAQPGYLWADVNEKCTSSITDDDPGSSPTPLLRLSTVRFIIDCLTNTATSSSPSAACNAGNGGFVVKGSGCSRCSTSHMGSQMRIVCLYHTTLLGPQPPAAKLPGPHPSN